MSILKTLRRTFTKKLSGDDERGVRRRAKPASRRARLRPKGRSTRPSVSHADAIASLRLTVAVAAMLVPAGSLLVAAVQHGADARARRIAVRPELEVTRLADSTSISIVVENVGLGPARLALPLAVIAGEPVGWMTPVELGSVICTFGAGECDAAWDAALRPAVIHPGERRTYVWASWTPTLPAVGDMPASLSKRDLDVVVRYSSFARDEGFVERLAYGADTDDLEELLKLIPGEELQPLR